MATEDDLPLMYPPPPPLVPMPILVGLDRQPCQPTLCASRDMERMQPLLQHLEAFGRGIKGKRGVTKNDAIVADYFTQAAEQAARNAGMDVEKMKEDARRAAADAEAREEAEAEAAEEEGSEGNNLGAELALADVDPEKEFLSHTIEDVLEDWFAEVPDGLAAATMEAARVTLASSLLLQPQGAWRPEALTGALLSALYLPSADGMAVMARRLAAGQGTPFNPEAALHLCRAAEQLRQENAEKGQTEYGFRFKGALLKRKKKLDKERKEQQQQGQGAQQAHGDDDNARKGTLQSSDMWEDPDGWWMSQPQHSGKDKTATAAAASGNKAKGGAKAKKARGGKAKANKGAEAEQSAAAAAAPAAAAGSPSLTGRLTASRVYIDASLPRLRRCMTLDFRSVEEARAAAAEWEMLARAGDHRALYFLSLHERFGVGVNGPNLQAAAQLLAEAALYGVRRAMRELGMRLLVTDGLHPGVQAQPAEAYRWLDRAARRGDQVACFVQALLLAVGHGVPPHALRAMQLMGRAAETIGAASFVNYPVRQSGSTRKDEVPRARNKVEARRIALAKLTGLGMSPKGLDAVPEALKRAGWWPQSTRDMPSDENAWGGIRDAPDANGTGAGAGAGEGQRSEKGATARAAPPHGCLSMPLHAIFPPILATAVSRAASPAEPGGADDFFQDEELRPWVVAATRCDLQSTMKLGWCYVRSWSPKSRRYKLATLMIEAERLHPLWQRGSMAQEFRAKGDTPANKEERLAAAALRQRQAEALACLESKQVKRLMAYYAPLPRPLTVEAAMQGTGPQEHGYDRRPRVDPLRDAPLSASEYCSTLAAMEHSGEPLLERAGDAATCAALMLLALVPSSPVEEAMGWIRRAADTSCGLAVATIYFYALDCGWEEQSRLWLMYGASLGEPVALGVDAYERAARERANKKLSHSYELPAAMATVVGTVAWEAYRRNRRTLWGLDYFTQESKRGQPLLAPRTEFSHLLRQAAKGAPLPGRLPRCALADVVGMLNAEKDLARRLGYARRTLQQFGMTYFQDSLLSPWARGGTRSHDERGLGAALLEACDDFGEIFLKATREALSVTVRLAYRLENWRPRDAIAAIIRPILEELEFGVMTEDDESEDEDESENEEAAAAAAAAASGGGGLGQGAPAVAVQDMMSHLTTTPTVVGPDMYDLPHRSPEDLAADLD
jgi:TPR repeat protein